MVSGPTRYHDFYPDDFDPIKTLEETLDEYALEVNAEMKSELGFFAQVASAHINYLSMWLSNVEADKLKQLVEKWKRYG